MRGSLSGMAAWVDPAWVDHIGLYFTGVAGSINPAEKMLSQALQNRYADGDIWDICFGC